MIYTDEMDGFDRWLLEAWMEHRIRKHGVDAPFPGMILPATGMCVRDDRGETLAVATLYLEKSAPVAVCGWCAANPLNSARQSADAVKLLLRVMPEYAKKCGAKFLLTTFGKRSLNRLLDQMGFFPGEKSETKIKAL